MTTSDDERLFDINRNTYDWCVRSFQAVRKRLGLNIKVHNDDGLMEQGHIFLFNHFARFETIIPPFVIHRTTGIYCRSVADHNLFEGNEKFAKFLRGVGAVPNNLPGLLPFLAAEILRGRKVVVFPEGGMVKDRRVLAEDGTFSIYSRKSLERRQHHRGAAVLAMTLDMFKRRILELHDRGDHKRIGRWVRSLGLKDDAELLARAIEPTLIVPATITFYPIHVEDNIVSRAADLLFRELPQKLAEEMKIEGNLLFRDTDMDIHIGQAIRPVKKWRWWEKFLLNRYFARSVQSLDDLFGLKDQPEGFAGRMLARCVNEESTRIRDNYMRAIYEGITVNLSHLASHLIVTLIGEGRMDVDRADFHKALYLGLKNLQAARGVNLHRSLLWPDRYRRLIEGESPELDRFLKTCRDSGLIEETPQSYLFLDKLRTEHTFDEVRLENPVLVYANEVAPLRPVVETMEAALKSLHGATEAEVGSLLFDDELRAHQWNRDHYATAPYAAINAKETATQDGAPYLLLPRGVGATRARTGVLLVHGFLASPAELRGLGEDLSRAGHAVLGVRLAGHGTSPWDLKRCEWRDWLASLERGLRILSAFAEKVVVVGFSAGGSLALHLVAGRNDRIAGVAAICAPLEFRERMMALVPLVAGLNKLASLLPGSEGVLPFTSNHPEHPDINYRSIPVQALGQLRAMTGELPRRLPAVTVPALIVQADGDPVVRPDSATAIHKNLGAADKALHWVKADRHGILYENIGDARALVLDFVARVG